MSSTLAWARHAGCGRNPPDCCARLRMKRPSKISTSTITIVFAFFFRGRRRGCTGSSSRNVAVIRVRFATSVHLRFRISDSGVSVPAVLYQLCLQHPQLVSISDICWQPRVSRREPNRRRAIVWPWTTAGTPSASPAGETMPPPRSNLGRHPAAIAPPLQTKGNDNLHRVGHDGQYQGGAEARAR